ncbi:MAG TPA: penicillin-binding transpeptidase domain-containing protein [Gemmatimonadales bacterium]|jgi:cell division protein FtsI (penicillin-binding protein 3)
MAKVATRVAFLQGVLGLAAVVVVVRSFQVQLLQHSIWVARVNERRSENIPVRAQRGRILDRNGRTLAMSEEQYHLSIALNEVRDTAALRDMLVRQLSLKPARVLTVLKARYPYFYGPFTADQIDHLRSVHGVHVEPVYNRVYPVESLADRLLGRLDQNGEHGVEGIEKSEDSLLQGTPGVEHYLLDARGTQLRAPDAHDVKPVAGNDIYLTIDADLQGIVEGALRRAVSQSGALGGDMVIINAHTGEILAVASLRTDSGRRLVSTSSAIVEPNEPGSTSKIFTVAAMLRDRVDTTPVPGWGGHWMMDVGGGVRRPLDDVDKRDGLVTLGETVKYSSNIAISQYAMRLTPAQQFGTIRDFGFGTPLALNFPGEAPGLLRRPALWPNRRYTQPSLGMGYEWEATAVQLAAGYGAIANGGVLMASSLLAAVRDNRGRLIWRLAPDTLRRAVPDSIAHHLLDYLALVTDSGGTGRKGQLDRAKLVGKTGTAQRRLAGGGYRSSFVAIYPRDHPQAVVYVMVDRPTASGKFYGGDVAAPIVRTVVQQALVSIASPLDRRDLTASAAIASARPVEVSEPIDVHAVAWPAPAVVRDAAREEIPTVDGRSLRDAIVALERAGFAVRLTGRAQVRGTLPAAGDSLARGSTVTLLADSLP